MKQSMMIMFLLYWIEVCNAFYASPMIKIQARSVDTVAALRQAAQVLNVAVPGNWHQYMDPSVTDGSTGSAQVGISTVSSVMATWPLPEQFRQQTVQHVRLLVIAASESAYVAQAFVFNAGSSASLSSLIIVANSIDSPSDPNSPIVVRYVIINGHAGVKQQFNSYIIKRCHKCPKCLWMSRCCCHKVVEHAPRGLTQQEINIIQQKLSADQYVWLSQQTLNRALTLSSLNVSHNDYNGIDIVEAIDKYLSNNMVKAEVLAKYNDSILTALQTNFTSLKLSTQKLKLTQISRGNIRMLLKALAKDYGFEDMLSDETQYVQQLLNPKFSFENLFLDPTENENTNRTLKYIWILGENKNNLTYTIHLLRMDLNLEVLIQTLSSNNTNTTDIINSNTQLKIVRTASLNDNGQFVHERLFTSTMPWTMQKIMVALNILRFISASTLAPKSNRMLSYFTPEIVTRNHNRNADNSASSTSSSNESTSLASTVTQLIDIAKNIIGIFKSSSSSAIVNRTTQAGFKHFQQKTRTLKVLKMPAERAEAFVNAIIMDYNLPSQSSFMLGLTYSDDFAWEMVEFLYSPEQNGVYRSLTVFKNGDSIANTASFIIVDIDAKWEIAQDLLIIEKRRSFLGGLFGSTKQSLKYIPHTLTIDEAKQIKEFFMVVTIERMARLVGIPAPELST